jgi:hypothetical protein
VLDIGQRVVPRRRRLRQVEPCYDSTLGVRDQVDVGAGVTVVDRGHRCTQARGRVAQIDVGVATRVRRVQLGTVRPRI